MIKTILGILLAIVVVAVTTMVCFILPLRIAVARKIKRLRKEEGLEVPYRVEDAPKGSNKEDGHV